MKQGLKLGEKNGNISEIGFKKNRRRGVTIMEHITFVEEPQ